MPIENVDNTDLKYYLVCYDKDGKEQTDGRRPAERPRLRRDPERARSPTCSS